MYSLDNQLQPVNDNNFIGHDNILSMFTTKYHKMMLQTEKEGKNK